MHRVPGAMGFGETVYCSLMGPEGFKVGLVFVTPDAETENAFRAFVA